MFQFHRTFFYFISRGSCNFYYAMHFFLPNFPVEFISANIIRSFVNKTFIEHKHEIQWKILVKLDKENNLKIESFQAQLD